jgi:hypothetical protein
LKIKQEIGDRRGEGNALWNISLVLYKLGNRSQAIVYAENALQVYEQIEASDAIVRIRLQLGGWRNEDEGI